MGWFTRLFMGPDYSETSPLPPIQPRDGAKGVVFEGSVYPDLVRTLAHEGAWPAVSYGAMYRKQPAVRAVVDFLGRNIGQLNPKVFERVGDVDRIEVGNHPLAAVLRRPNPVTTRYRHIRDTVQDLAIYDRAVWAKMRGAGRLVVVRIPPQHMSAVTVDGGTRYVDNRTGEQYRRSDLVIFHGYSPDGDDHGVSPLETLRRVLAEEWAAQQHREFMWRNAARQSGWIERPDTAPEWTDDARRRFRADLEAIMSGGSNAGRIGVLEEGMKWNPASFSPKDTEYIEGRRLTYEEVCVQYGMKPGLLGMGGDTAASAEAAHRHAYQDVLGPWLRMLQDEIELQLLPDLEPMNTRGTVYVEFNLAEKLKGSFEEQSKSIVSSVGVPYMSVNEGRARLNLPRIDEEWADQPVQPLNVMYGGQASVVTPTADPSTASAPAPRAKAAPDESHRTDATAEHVSLLRAYFERQERSVLSSWGGKAFKSREKWDDELRAALFEQATNTTRTVGLLTAGQLRGRYDQSRVAAWLSDNADRTAKAVNDQTFEAIDAAADLDEVKHVFEVAKTHRADALGFGLATALVNFARTEAARHSEDADGRARVKTWVVTNPKSRHPQMHGETVRVSENFSNGGRWPGDPSLGADEAAGCNCQLELGEAP